MEMCRITGTQPETWTLFIHGPRRKFWGFLRPTEVSTGTAVIYHQPFPPSDPT